jgi:hypothetical protein
VSRESDDSDRIPLCQDVISRAPEIKRDVEVAIREGSVDGLLTEGVKAVVSLDAMMMMVMMMMMMMTNHLIIASAMRDHPLQSSPSFPPSSF